MTKKNSGQGLVSDLALGEAFMQLCKSQGAERFAYQDAILETSDAADSNQLLPVFAAFAALTADKSNMGANDLPVIFAEDAQSLTGTSCKFRFSESSFPPSVVLTLLDHAVTTSLEASNTAQLGNLDYLAHELHKTYVAEDSLNVQLQ
jgi:hypothetical protein